MNKKYNLKTTGILITMLMHISGSKMQANSAAFTPSVEAVIAFFNHKKRADNKISTQPIEFEKIIIDFLLNENNFQATKGGNVARTLNLSPGAKDIWFLKALKFMYALGQGTKQAEDLPSIQKEMVDLLAFDNKSSRPTIENQKDQTMGSIFAQIQKNAPFTRDLSFILKNKDCYFLNGLEWAYQKGVASTQQQIVQTGSVESQPLSEPIPNSFQQASKVLDSNALQPPKQKITDLQALAQKKQEPLLQATNPANATAVPTPNLSQATNDNIANLHALTPNNITHLPQAQYTSPTAAATHHQRKASTPLSYAMPAQQEHLKYSSPHPPADQPVFRNPLPRVNLDAPIQPLQYSASKKTQGAQKKDDTTGIAPYKIATASALGIAGIFLCYYIYKKNLLRGFPDTTELTNIREQPIPSARQTKGELVNG